MATNYDPIAEHYRRAKQHPWREHVEAFTMKTLLGDLAGKSVLDVACGEGFYSRMLRQMGAAAVTGVDLSEKMIELAQAAEQQHNLGIEYVIGDGRSLNLGQQYDLVVAAYLLNYAHDAAELEAMCRGVARCLKPHGRFVAVNSNPACNYPAAPSYRKYGFEISVVGEFRQGAPLAMTFHLDDGSFEIENYFLSVETHEQALRAAGFREIRWHQPMLSPQAEATDGREYWSDLIDHPPVIFLECFV